jgi:hypothetical protein
MCRRISLPAYVVCSKLSYDFLADYGLFQRVQIYVFCCDKINVLHKFGKIFFLCDVVMYLREIILLIVVLALGLFFYI